VCVFVCVSRPTYSSGRDRVIYVFALWLSNEQFYDTCEEYACLPTFDLFNNSARTLQETQCFPVTRTSRSTLFRESFAVDSCIHTKHINVSVCRYETTEMNVHSKMKGHLL
jgi:hypothetical protein